MFKQRTLDVNGTPTFLLEAGTGPLVLLCHGFPETAYAWRHQLKALAEAGFQAVAPDLRGVGQTPGPADLDQYSLMHLLGDLVGIVEALGQKTALIVGNDWGASLAWQAALIRPDIFRAVTAIGVPMMARSPLPPTQIFPQTPEALFYTLYFQQVGQAEQEFTRDVETTLRKIYFNADADARANQPREQAPNPFAMVPREAGFLAPLQNPSTLPAWLQPQDLAVFVEAFTHSGFSGALNLYRNLDRNWELQAAFAGKVIEVPALFCIGEHDVGWSMPGMQAIIEQQVDLVPDLRGPEIIANAGHWLPQEAPAAFNQHLIRFAKTVLNP